MNKEEILAKAKELYELTKEYLVEHKNVSAFIGGCVVGFILATLVT